MDFKALLAKITGKNKEAPAGGVQKKKSSVSVFFENNPAMKFVIALIAIVVSIAVAVVIILSYRSSKLDLNTDVRAADSGEAVEVLPQIERDVGGEYEGKDPFTENILDGAKLTGVIETYGYKSAILQTSTKAYTLFEGDTVGDSEWTVSEITDKSITLVSGDKTKTFSK